MILVALLLFACAPEEPVVREEPPGMARGTLVIETSSGTVRIDVAIAETVEERTRGLMGVPRLGEDEGMVFLHDTPTRSAFTMRNTLIPLSLAVWGPDGRIRAILDMEPCRKEPCPTYVPGVEWVGAVEVNAGYFRRNGVEVGDSVRLER